MQIVELGDCSMVIMKDSDDPPWMSVGDIYRKAVKHKSRIAVERFLGTDPDFNAYGQVSSDYILYCWQADSIFQGSYMARISIT